MIDLHLINLALASLGISAVAVVLIAAAVIIVAAAGRRRAVARLGQPSPAVTRVPATVPAKMRATLRAKVRAEAPAEESGRPGQARREPALR
jgi:hypothetical protein